MSAFTVDATHIDALVNAALQYADMRGDYATAARIGALLWDENYRSVNYRYNDHDVPPEYRPTLTDAELSPVAILKAIDCYTYQACESPDWEVTDAHRLVEEIRAEIYRRHPDYARPIPCQYDRTRTRPAYKALPEYDAAPWEVTSLDSVTVAQRAAETAAAVEAEAHRGEGAVYRSVGRLDIVEVAKRMRVNLRNAQSLGMLPEGATFSVTTERYSMGQSVTVTVRGMPDTWTYAEPVDGEFGRRYSDAAQATMSAIRDMLSEYNRDRSDSMTDYYDVWFHQSVSIESESGARWRAEEATKRKTRAAARKARRQS